MMRALQVLLLSLGFLGASLQAQIRVSGVVYDESNTPLIGAYIVIENTNTGTSSDANGRYEIEVPTENSTLLFSYLGYGAEVVEIAGRSSIDVTLSPAATDLDVVVLVGSRNPNRSKLETPVPIDVVDIQKIKALAPQLTISDMINYLVPSFNNNRQSASDGTEHIDPASLRGLGPDQVLVLVNGKRRHTTSLVNYQNTVGNGSVGTDLSAIPASAVDRIEVLRDGAAAQYGSDAIAGVINVVLKKSAGLDANITYGQTSRGDGETIDVNAYFGTKIGDRGGYLGLSTQIMDRAKTTRTNNHDLIIFDQSEFGNFFAYDFTEDPAASRQIDNDLLAQNGLVRSDFDFQVGDAAVTNLQFFLNGGLPIGASSELYLSAGYSNRQGEGFGFRRLPSETDNVVAALHPFGFQPILESDIADISASAGIRGQWGEWKYDISNTSGNNNFGYTVSNTNNASLGANSATSFDAGSHSFFQNTTNVDLTRHFDILAGLSTSFGSEYRIENFTITAGEEGSYINGGAQSFPGFSPLNEVDENRNNIAFYADAELDLSENFLISAATRFENYSDFGSTLNWKLASRWALNDYLALRGAISTGFRAPSVQQQFFNNSSLDIGQDGSQLVTDGIFNQKSDITSAFGIPELKEETSLNLSIGATIRPIENWSITLDAYQIDIDDRIVLTSSITGRSPFDGSILNQDIVDILDAQGISGARFMTNAINTSTQGVDMVITYNTFFGNTQSLRVDLAGNWNKTEITDYNFPSSLPAGDRSVYFDSSQESLIETNNPRLKGNLSLTYNMTKLSLLLRNTYFGEVTRDGFPFGEVQVHDPKLVTDISASYALNHSLKITLGANNLFDVFPDEQLYSNSYFGVFKYAPVQMGTTGSYFFARLGLQL